MTAKEKIDAYREDIERLMSIIKTLPPERAKEEADKIWQEIRYREIDSDFDSTYGNEPFYEHCCKTCAYRLRLSKKYGAMACAILSSGIYSQRFDFNPNPHCCLVDNWKRTRKEQNEKE